MGFALTDEEWQQIASTSDDEQRHHAIAAIVNVRSNTGWTTDGHTGVDVEVFAFGAGARQFVGQLDNTDIAKRLLAFVGHRAAPSEVKKPVVKVDEASNISSDASGCDFKADWRCQ